MRRPGNLLIGSAIGISALAAAMLAGCGGSDDTATSSSAAVNVTLAAANGRLATDRAGVLRLTLRGVDPRVEVSDVSPGTGRSWEPTWAWVRSWKTLYKGYEPNTTISWGTGRVRERTTVALMSGTHRGRSIVFKVRPLGSTGTGPLPSVAAPSRARDLGPVQVFVDPPAEFPGSAFVQQELASAANATKVTAPAWNAIANRPFVSPAPGGGAYGGITAAPNQVVSLELQGNVAFTGVNLPGRTLVPTNPDGIGGFFISVNLTGGGLNLAGGASSAFVGNNVFDNLNLTNGTLTPPSEQFMEYIPDSAEQDLLDAWDDVVRPASDADVPAGSQEVPTGNSFIRPNLNGATVSAGYLGDSLFAGPSLAGTTWSAGVEVPGTAFLGADFTGVTFPSSGTASFAGATIAPVTLPTPDGASMVNSSFKGMTLGTSVSFGASGSTDGALLVGVDFSGASLQGTQFTGATINNATFANADLGQDERANFNGVSLSNVDFTGAVMGGATFNGAAFSGIDFTQSQFGDATVSFQGARIGPGTQFPGNVGPTDVSFAGAVLNGVSFSGSPSPEFIASTMSSVRGTGINGVQMGGTTYLKAGSVVYQVVGTQWQPLKLVAGPQLVPDGAAIAPLVNGGGGENPNNGNDDNNNNNDDGNGGGDEPVDFGG